MDLPIPKYFQAPPVFSPLNEPTTLVESNSKNSNNPFADNFEDPLCKLNLKETSDFVKSFPMPSKPELAGGYIDLSSSSSSVQRRREGVNPVSVQRRSFVEAPPTPGRPVFSFSASNSTKKCFPSKWDDAEKWLISSPAHPFKPSQPPPPPPPLSEPLQQCDQFHFKQKVQAFVEKPRVSEDNVTKFISSFQKSMALESNSNGGCSASTYVLLKDKFTDQAEPFRLNFKYSEPLKEGFVFGNAACEIMKDAGTEVIHDVKHKDVGTEMTPLGSSTTSRCHTPFKSPSPARHNTPINRSGPLALTNSGSIDISHLQQCHLDKLQFGCQYDSITSNWSSKEEEEEEISKSLRHFETGTPCKTGVLDSRAASWEEEEKTNCCLRYQREEAKIQAWLNLQSAKAEAQSRKLEVKIEKMRSKLEEKLMKRMLIMHRKAEEWREAARQQHQQQMEQAQKMIAINTSTPPPHISHLSSCGCFPCNKLINHCHS